MDGPESAAERRPNDEPYYLDSDCPDCGESLVYYHELPDSAFKESDYLCDVEHRPTEDEEWFDEFVCPDCLNGIHMDWPPDYEEAFNARIEQSMKDIEEGNFTTLEELEEALDL